MFSITGLVQSPPHQADKARSSDEHSAVNSLRQDSAFRPCYGPTFWVMDMPRGSCVTVQEIRKSCHLEALAEIEVGSGRAVNSAYPSRIASSAWCALTLRRRGVSSHFTTMPRWGLNQNSGHPQLCQCCARQQCCGGCEAKCFLTRSRDLGLRRLRLGLARCFWFLAW